MRLEGAILVEERFAVVRVPAMVARDYAGGAESVGGGVRAYRPSTRTPGFMIPSGSNDALTAPSASAKASGRCSSYQGR